MSDNLVTKTATELGDLFAKGDASPVEATEAVLGQIEKHNSTLNCFCLIDPEAALSSARKSEKRWQSGVPLSAIDGVPTSIKDLTLTKGWPTLRGSCTTNPDGPWDEDAPATARVCAVWPWRVGRGPVAPRESLLVKCLMLKLLKSQIGQSLTSA